MHPRATVGMPQANPRTGMPRLRRSWRRRRRAAATPRPRLATTYCASNKGQGWSLLAKVGGQVVESYKATTSGSKMMYGLEYWKINLAPRPDFPQGFSEWVPRCGAEPRF